MSTIICACFPDEIKLEKNLISLYREDVALFKEKESKKSMMEKNITADEF